MSGTRVAIRKAIGRRAYGWCRRATLTTMCAVAFNLIGSLRPYVPERTKYASPRMDVNGHKTVVCRYDLCAVVRSGRTDVLATGRWTLPARKDKWTVLWRRLVVWCPSLGVGKWAHTLSYPLTYRRDGNERVHLLAGRPA